MKEFSNFYYAIAVQLAVTWLAPGLTIGVFDKLAISVVLIIFCVIFILGAKKILRTLSVSQAQFNAKFFGSMGLRIIIALISIAMYLVFSPVINKFGAIFLLISYFVYMGFEIQIILHKLRTDSEKSKNTDDARK